MFLGRGVVIGRDAGRLAALGLVVAILAACSDSRPTESLRAMPEAAIVFPGSVSVKEVATPQVDSPDGKSGATYGHMFGANAGVDEVVAWFDAELMRRGWGQISPGSTNNSLAVVLWTNGDAQFRIAVNSPADLTPDLQAKLKGYSIEIDARVQQIYPAPSG